MTIKIYEKSLTGKESDSDLDELIEKYFNPQKIKQLRFVFVLKHYYEKFERKVEYYQRGDTWIRVNHINGKRTEIIEGDFNNLIIRTRKTMEIPKKLIGEPEYFKFVVYGTND